ncbi:MAG: hypothetical protein Q9175_003908 [Cornicularia normoerica]
MSDLDNSTNCDESVQSSEDQRAALQQKLDPGNKGIRYEESATAFEALDVDVVMGESTEAPRIETHLVDEDENVPNQAIPARGKDRVCHSAPTQAFAALFCFCAILLDESKTESRRLGGREICRLPNLQREA